MNNIEQILGNVLTSATKNKETIVQKHFRQTLPSSSVRREMNNKQEGAGVKKKIKNEYV